MPKTRRKVGLPIQYSCAKQRSSSSAKTATDSKRRFFSNAPLRESMAGRRTCISTTGDGDEVPLVRARFERQLQPAERAEPYFAIRLDVDKRVWRCPARTYHELTNTMGGIGGAV